MTPKLISFAAPTLQGKWGVASFGAARQEA